MFQRSTSYTRESVYHWGYDEKLSQFLLYQTGLAVQRNPKPAKKIIELPKHIYIYSEFYDKMLLAGDFNAEEGESCFDSFLFEYNLKNLVKEKICYKNPENPSYINLFLTSNARSFQKTTTVSTGLSDFHKMIVTVLKTKLAKQKPKEIIYRSYLIVLNFRWN